MGRIVPIDTDWQSLAVPGTGGAAIDLLEVKLASTQYDFVMGAYLFQHSYEAITKLEQLKISLRRGNGYTSGSSLIGASQSVLTPVYSTGQAAHGLNTVKMLNTTVATAGGGSLDVLHPGVFNISAGEWERVFIPEMRIPLAPSEGIIFRMDEALEETMILRAVLYLDLFG